jgi:hypothetical protein
MTDMTVAINARSLANERGGGHIATLRQLLPYLWPAGRTDLHWRVVVALIALFASKVVTVWAPFAFKDAVGSPRHRHVGDGGADPRLCGGPHHDGGAGADS